MKKIRDISTNTYSENVDVFIPEISEVSPDSLGENNTENITRKRKKDITFSKKNTVIVEEKKTKNFDALEKSVSLFGSRKNIILQKKQDNFLVKSEIFFSKKIRNIRKLGYFAILSFVLCFAIMYGLFSKVLIENRVNSGYEKLLYVKSGNIGFEQIRKNINNARFDFFLSDILYTPFSVIPHDKIQSVKYVISGGRNISKGLDEILSLYDKIFAFTHEKEIQKIYFTQLFLNIYNDVYKIRDTLRQGKIDYEKISWLPNNELLSQKNVVVQSLENLTSYLDIFLGDFPAFINMLGHEERRRYLIVFQNADEIRPTGGFMGSMALVEMFKGQVKLFQKKDVYAIEWDLKSADYQRLVAPKGINELTDTFGLRDANYFINLKDSSQAIKFFTDRANLEIDGIIYINQNILLKFLELTGPIYFDPIGRDISSENFSEIMSLLVESKISQQGTLGTPKQILFDFIQVFIGKLLEEKKYFDYLQIILHESLSRDIMMWSFHPEENVFLQNIGLVGDVDFNSSLDFMYPVYTSLSGNKSDRYMHYTYTKNVAGIENTCDFDVSTRIKSSHNMTKNTKDRILGFIDEYGIDSQNILEIQGNARNRQYVRIILPKNSEITPQAGMDIIDYGERKGVEFFLETQVQQSSFYDFSYRLKNPDCKSFDTIFYKQPGIPKFDVSLNVSDEQFDFFGISEDFYFQKY